MKAPLLFRLLKVWATSQSKVAAELKLIRIALTTLVEIESIRAGLVARPPAVESQTSQSPSPFGQILESDMLALVDAATEDFRQQFQRDPTEEELFREVETRMYRRDPQGAPPLPQ